MLEDSYVFELFSRHYIKHVNRKSIEKKCERCYNALVLKNVNSNAPKELGNDVLAGENKLRYIGKIDKEIFNCVVDDIVTDDVIITKERLQHIKERHPNDFDKCMKYIAERIKSPQYIIEANKTNTAVILNSFENDEYKAILRITASSDDPNYKNSIITYQKIHKKEWKRLLKNKKILYKSE